MKYKSNGILAATRSIGDWTSSLHLPVMKISSLHLEHNIQVNEESHKCDPYSEDTGEIRIGPNGPYRKYGFTCENCTEYLDGSSGLQLYPKRCSGCCREINKWRRNKAYKKLLKKHFNPRRHAFLKFLTFSMPGHKYLNELIDHRSELIRRFNLLRKTEFWTEHVDGGIWFYEFTTNHSENQTTIDSSIAFPDGEVFGTINPHMHVILMGPKKIPMKVLNQRLATYGLGHAYITTPRDRSGRYLSNSDTGIKNAIGYVMGYLNKPSQADSKNRQAFGCLYGKGCR